MRRTLLRIAHASYSNAASKTAAGRLTPTLALRFSSVATRPAAAACATLRVVPTTLHLHVRTMATAADAVASAVQNAAAVAITNVTFNVRVDCAPGEYPCVVGSCEELGGWDALMAPRLQRTDEGLWTATIALPTVRKIEYKYVVCCDWKSASDFRRVVERWETTLSNRQCVAAGESVVVDDGEFGRFGVGAVQVDEGWLTQEVELHVRLGNLINRPPVRLLSHGGPLRVRMSPIDLSDGTEQDFRSVGLRVLRLEPGGEASPIGIPHHAPVLQQQNGTRYVDGDIFVFNARSLSFDSTAFALDVFADGDDGGAQRVGRAVLLPSQLPSSLAEITAPIVSATGVPVGEILLDCLICKPLRHPGNDMAAVWASYWNKSRGALDVGHRGLGNSQENAAYKRAPITENTIMSLSTAARHGADFVEFDVQLTKDCVPVIYHNFKICATLQKRNVPGSELYEVDVRDLTLAQLRRLQLESSHRKSKMFSKLLRERRNSILAMAKPQSPTRDMAGADSPPHAAHTMSPPPRDDRSRDERRRERLRELRSAPAYAVGDDDEVALQEFPTLREVFENVPANVGFNIEIKFPVTDASEKQRRPYWDHNTYVDTILRVIFDHAGSRRIVISCFDPDICTLFRLKQPRYPVFFLTCGGSRQYAIKRDIRCNSVENAMLFAKAQRLLGIVTNSRPILANMSLIPFIKSEGLILFTWGDENNSEESIRTQKAAGVDAVIYDRINDFKHTSLNVFEVEELARTAKRRRDSEGTDDDAQSPKAARVLEGLPAHAAMN